MINYTPTPDYYNEYICHYNHNHDPRNGQFTTGDGGSGGSSEEAPSKKKAKKKIFYTLAGLEKGLKKGTIDVDDLSRKQWGELSDKQVKYADIENPGFKRWYGEHDPNYENYDVKNPEKHVQEFKKWKDQRVQTIKQNDQKISKSIAKDMIKDFDRWGSEDNSRDFFFKIDGKKVTKEKMQKHLEQQISQRIKEVDSKPFDMEVYDYSSEPNIIGVQINGIKEYSNGAPLSIEYDTKKKKIDYWGYS